MSKEELISSYAPSMFVTFSPLIVVVVVLAIIKIIRLIDGEDFFFDSLVSGLVSFLVLVVGLFGSMSLHICLQTGWDEKFADYVDKIPTESYVIEAVGNTLVVSNSEGVFPLDKEGQYKVVIEDSGKPYLKGKIVTGFEEIGMEDTLEVDSIHITLDDLKGDYKGLYSE